MSSRIGALRAPLVAVTAAALVALGPGVASADDDPVRDVVKDVHSQVEQEPAPEEAAPESSQESATADQPAPASSPPDNADNADAERPATYAKSQVAKLAIAGNDVLDLARSEASIDDDGDTSRADATLLALGGQEVIGTHADSDGEKETHQGDPLWALCEGSEGQLCLRVLFADAYADEDSDSSESMSKTGVADVCVGGDTADRKADCAAPVSVGVGTSKAQAKRDKTSGATQSSSESAVVDACLGQEDGACALELKVLQASSAASSDGQSGGDSVLVAGSGGDQGGAVDQEVAVEVPPGCPEGESALCAYLNQGTAQAAGPVASAAQEALGAVVLPGNLDGVVSVSGTEVSAAQGAVLGVEAAAGNGGPGKPGAGDGDGGGDDGDGAGVLPDTGGVWSGLLAVALGALAAGSFLIARNRRRLGALA